MVNTVFLILLCKWLFWNVCMFLTVFIKSTHLKVIWITSLFQPVTIQSVSVVTVTQQFTYSNISSLNGQTWISVNSTHTTLTCVLTPPGRTHTLLVFHSHCTVYRASGVTVHMRTKLDTMGTRGILPNCNILLLLFPCQVRWERVCVYVCVCTLNL